MKSTHAYTNYHGIKILATRTSLLHEEVLKFLSEKMAKSFGRDVQLVLTGTHYEEFPDGEVLTHQTESLRDSDVFIIAQPRGTLEHLAADIDEIRALVHTACYIGSAHRVNIVVPYFPYQKQDRESKPREPVSIKRLFNEFFNAGVSNIITVQLHNLFSQHYADTKVENINAMGFMLKKAEVDLSISWKDFVFVSPDIGAGKFVGYLAEKVGVDYAIIDKRRKGNRDAEVRNIIGKDLIQGRDVWIWDDQIASGGTLIAAKEALEENGASSVSAGAPHGIFSKNACQILPNAGFKHLLVTDSYPLPESKRFPGLSVISVAELLAGAIDNIHNGGSISGLNTFGHF
ncbi:MAG: ribose-phosphate pyrophosphokinase [Candidatus Pacebacteria bacterium]|nr:ribose-phosphate pyrophosphokinase [Candidatus Paceibacterota bacterium]